MARGNGIARAAMSEFAIVGLGSWGLCVLERTVNRARHVNTSVRVHVIEPGQLGGGVYSAAQPDYLILNNPCGQLSLYAAPDDDEDPSLRHGTLRVGASTRATAGSGYEYEIGTDGETDSADRLPAAPADGRVPGLVLRGTCSPTHPRISRSCVTTPPHRHHARDRRSRSGTARQRHRRSASITWC